MEIFLKVNGIKIKLMGKEFIDILMDLDMMVNGRMIYNMVLVKNNGMMVQDILVNIFKGKNKVKENMNGQMVLIMKVIGIIIK